MGRYAISYMSGEKMVKADVVNIKYREKYATLISDFNIVSDTDPRQVQIELLDIPREYTKGMIKIDGTVYNLVNGLVARDGFYIESIGNSLSLVAKVKDKNIFRIFLSNESETDKKVKKFKIKIYDSTTNLYDFLLALGCISNKDEYLNVFRECSDFLSLPSVLKSREQLAKDYFNKLYGYDTVSFYKNELPYRTFDGFFGTNENYINKKIFFSLNRFVGFRILKCKQDHSLDDREITPVLARDIDESDITELWITDGRKKFFYKVDKSPKFCENDLLNAINILAIAIKTSKSIKCDLNAIYNRKIYGFEDYIEDYVKSVMTNTAKKLCTSRVFDRIHIEKLKLDSFKYFMEKNYQKVLEATSLQNTAELYSKPLRFSKDIFKSEHDILLEDRQIHPTYIEWLSTITSDTEKVGLNGLLLDDVLHNGELSREYYYTSEIEDEDDDFASEQEKTSRADTKSKLFKSYEIFNKIICYQNIDNTHLCMLNGRELEPEYKECSDLFCITEELKDPLTGITICNNSNHPKRDLLGYKAVGQSLELITYGLDEKTGALNKYSNKEYGITVRDMIEFSSKMYQGLLSIKNTTEEIKVLNVENNGDTFIIRYVVEDYELEYRHPSFLYSPSHSNRLEFLINYKERGIYKLDDFIIKPREFNSLGIECNITYGNFEGYTYEDGITITSNFVKKCGLATKTYKKFSYKLKAEPKEIIDKQLGFDRYGLPKVGTYINIGDIILNMIVDDKAVVQSSNIFGYVEKSEIKYKDNHKAKEAVVILSYINKLKPGDKVNNGHGNKGVVIKVIDSEDLVTDNGEDIDIILNPIGTLGRANSGQIKEMLSNNICTELGERIDISILQSETKSISELYSEYEKLCDKNGKSTEVTLYYKGEKLHNKFFIGKMNMYRSQYISRAHLNYIERPNLNLNGNITNGQKMSELASLALHAYDAGEVLEYLKVYQSHSRKNYNYISGARLLSNNPKLNRVDSTMIRISALFKSIGLKFTEDGIEPLNKDDVSGLLRITDNIDVLTKEKIHGKFDVENPAGYEMKVGIIVGKPIIMPNILNKICEVLYCKRESEDATVVTQKFKKELISGICEGKYAVDLEDDCVIYVKQNNNMLNGNYKVGYYEFVELLNKIDINKLKQRYESILTSEDVTKKDIAFFETPYKKLKELIEAFDGANFIEEVTLDCIPVAPINLRPMLEDDMSVNTINQFYQRLLGNTKYYEVYKNLSALVEDLKIRLHSHSGSEEDKSKNIISHGEKKSELRDNLFSRSYSNTGRSVITFDNDLDIDTISLPTEMFIGCLKEIIIKEVMNVAIKENYTTTNGEISQALTKIVINNSFKLVEKTLRDRIINAMDRLCESIKTISLREPMIRRQGMYSFKLTYHFGDSIKVNPAICNSFNLDVDGDAMAVYMILNKMISMSAYDKLNPYNGIVDFNKDKIWFSPRQDQLLALHMMTIEPNDRSITRTYVWQKPDFDVANKFKFLNPYVYYIYMDIVRKDIKVTDNICIVNEDGSVIVTTAGKLLIFTSIFRNENSINLNLFEKFLNCNIFPMTNKNSSNIIEFIVKEIQIQKDVLLAIKNLNNLAFNYHTYKGVTLSPVDISKTFSKIDEMDKTNITSMFRGDIDIVDELQNLGDAKKFIRYSKLNSDKLSISKEKAIDECIETSEFFKCVMDSGCRGTRSDLYQLFGNIGSVKYGDKIFNVNSCYNKGVPYTDKIKLSMPVRNSNVGVQTNLGKDGAKLRNSAVFNSNIKGTRKNCSADFRAIPLLYDMYIDGIPLSECEFCLGEKDTILYKNIFKVIPITDKETLNGKFIENNINYLRFKGENITTLNGYDITFKLSEASKKLIKSKNVQLGNYTGLGNDSVIKLVEDLKQPFINMKLIYFCHSDDLVCKECYGKCNNFPGNVGVNTAFSLREVVIQGILDSSKSSKGDIKVSTIDISSFMSTKNLSNILYIPEKATIDRLSPDVFLLHKTLGSVEDYFSEYVCIDGRLINTKMSPLDTINASEDIQLFQYIYILSNFSKDISVNDIEVMLINNLKNVIYSNGKIEKVSERNFEVQRIWINNTLAKREKDLISQLCMEDSGRLMLDNAMRKKKFSEDSIFKHLSYSITKRKPSIVLENVIQKTSINKPLANIKKIEDTITREEDTEIVDRKVVVETYEFTSPDTIRTD